MLEGELTFWVVEPELRTDAAGSRRTRAAAASARVAFVPGGTPHTFRVESDTARMLFLSTPAGIEDYVRALAEPAQWPWLQPPPDGPRVAAERLAAVEREHGVVRHRTAATGGRPKGGGMNMRDEQRAASRPSAPTKGRPCAGGRPAGSGSSRAPTRPTARSASSRRPSRRAAPRRSTSTTARPRRSTSSRATIELTCGDQTLTAAAGDFVYTPRDVPHKYAVVGEQPARVLLLFSRPGLRVSSSPKPERRSTSRPPGHPTPSSSSASSRSTTWSSSRRLDTDDPIRILPGPGPNRRFPIRAHSKGTRRHGRATRRGSASRCVGTDRSAPLSQRVAAASA